MQTEVAFQLSGGPNPLILVPVRVNETGPHAFILDTGARATFISRALATRLGIRAEGEREAFTAGGPVRVSPGRVASIAIGGATMGEFDVAIADLRDLEKTLGASIDGNAGYSLLKHFRVTVDFPTSTLQLSRGARSDRHTERALARVPFGTTNRTRPLVLVSPRVNGRGPYTFLVDTGCSTTLVSPSLARETGLLMEPGTPIWTGGGHTMRSFRGRLDSFEIGAARVENLDVSIADAERFLGLALGVNLDGIVGYNFLSAFRVTIDYPGNSLYLL